MAEPATDGSGPHAQEETPYWVKATRTVHQAGRLQLHLD